MCNKHEQVEEAVGMLLKAMGRDPKTDIGIEETPARVARMFTEFESKKDFKFSTFPANGTDQMVVVSGIQFYSFCEHHLLPFHGVAAIGYIPNPEGQICGLSTLARVVDMFALQPQTQEYLTNQVAEFLEDKLGAKGVGVLMRAEHLCMSMRGVRKPGSFTTTSSLRGVLMEKPEARDEFLTIARGM
jgi:GTP cyclohydrolase I